MRVEVAQEERGEECRQNTRASALEVVSQYECIVLRFPGGAAVLQITWNLFCTLVICIPSGLPSIEGPLGK